jgi:PAS domain S-box-containing protein
MYIRTGLNSDYVLTRARHELMRGVGILLPAMLIMLGMAIVFCKRSILDKISALQDVTRKVAHGDLSVRIPDHFSGGELGELGLAFNDMADRLQQAGEAQRESENKYRELVENANSIILKLDAEGKIIFFNEYAQRLFGFTEAEILGHAVLGTIVPETESTGRDLVQVVREIIAHHDSDSFSVNENICKNGTRVWVSWNNHTLSNADGSKAGILSIGQDITEQKRTEKELQRSEQRFRTFVENANDIVFALTTTGEFSYVSPNWTEAFGYEIGETIGKPFTPFVHPDDAQSCVEFMQQVFETGQKQSGVEYRVLCKNGTYLWYKANASLIQDPASGAATLIGIGRDISGLKASEEILRQSEERFEAAFHASPDAISLSRLGNGKYLDINEGFTELTGYPPEEVIGKSAIELNIWDNHLDRVRLLLDLRENGTITGRHFQFRRKDGSTRTGQMAARIIEINSEPYLLAITRDITLHEHVQKELIKAQKLDSISILAGGIAHNFNNVLTGVIGYISYAKNHLGEPDTLLKTLEAAEKSSYRAAGIARQLLTFSQRSTPVKNNVSIDTLVQESVELFLSGSNVTGTVDCYAHQTLSVDSQQISQAFNNIVLNALQAMPDGGMLTVTTHSVSLNKNNLYSLPVGSYTRIAFSDTGCGIARDNLIKVYDPYFTTRDSGTGLGLSTTHSIVSKHGGHIDISSRVGKGTTVSILLPTSAEKQEGDRGSTEQSKVEPTGGLILVMDDEEMIRQVTEEVLINAGFDVVTCSRGEEALALYREFADSGNSFSLTILDLSVPEGMGGAETARCILNSDPNAHIMAASGYSNDPAISDYRAFGFCGAIAKPYSSDELVTAVHNALK